VYNMYSWDQPADEQTEQSAAVTTSNENSGKAYSPVNAVQVALDRRDNGGDASPRRGR
jgi:hypothetical protein